MTERAVSVAKTDVKVVLLGGERYVSIAPLVAYFAADPDSLVKSSGLAAELARLLSIPLDQEFEVGP